MSGADKFPTYLFTLAPTSARNGQIVLKAGSTVEIRKHGDELAGRSRYKRASTK